MKAWGHRSFDNDIAIAWLDGLGDGLAGLRHIRRTLNDLLKAWRKGVISVDDGAAAVAAAEVVAAARGRGIKELPEKVLDWIYANTARIAPGDAGLAATAVNSVWQKSELRDEWSKTGANNKWRPHVYKLINRLQSEPKQLPARKPAKKK